MKNTIFCLLLILITVKIYSQNAESSQKDSSITNNKYGNNIESADTNKMINLEALKFKQLYYDEMKKSKTLEDNWFKTLDDLLYTTGSYNNIANKYLELYNKQKSHWGTFFIGTGIGVFVSTVIYVIATKSK
jgi:hypothetical protein